MKSYARVAIINLSGDVLLEVAGIEPGQVDAFRTEVAHELGALLGVNREVAQAMISVDVADAVWLPVPSCFELSDRTRSAFAREAAAAIKPYFTPAASDVGAAA